MRRSTSVRTLAFAATVTLALAACGNGDGDDGDDDAAPAEGGDGDALTIGSLLPQTGNLSFLGPPQIAGVDLAIQEVNEAGGVFGQDVEIVHRDSGDSDQAQVVSQSVTDLQGSGVAAIIGAAASGVTDLVIDDIVGSEIIMISPANTANHLSGASEWYFRTAPPDVVQGDVLGNLIAADGNATLAIYVFNDSYGTGLRDVIQEVFEDVGGTLVYGDSGDEFDTQEQNFGTVVGNGLAEDPDAVVILAFDQTELVIPELVNQGYDMSSVYFVDGNLSSYGDTFDDETLEGAQGTLPGPFPPEEFQERLLDIDSGLSDFSYAMESYDATMMVVLAAVKAGSTDPEAIRDELAAVSGADGGTPCADFEECFTLLEDGEEIDYQAASGVGPFNENNDPSSAEIGIYRYDESNEPQFERTESGDVPIDVPSE